MLCWSIGVCYSHDEASSTQAESVLFEDGHDFTEEAHRGEGFWRFGLNAGIRG